MRRAHPPPEPSEALLQFEAMREDASGLVFMLAFLPKGSSPEDAKTLYKRLRQESRTPCACIDKPLGIRRD